MVQVVSGIGGLGLGAAAFIRSWRTEEREGKLGETAASQKQVEDLWKENRELRADNDRLWDALQQTRDGALTRDREMRAELATMRETYEAQVRRLEGEHRRCRDELAALRRRLA